jgi:hypothetical protein
MTPFIDPVAGDFCVGDPITLSSSNGAGTPEWVLVEGPGNAVFTSPGEAATQVTVDAPGIYYFTVQYEEVNAVVAPCAGYPAAGDELVGVCNPAGPSWVQWSVVSPSPGPAIIYQSQQPETFFYAPVAGTYNFELKCYYYEDSAGTVTPAELPQPPSIGNPNSLDAPILDCPMGVVAGDPINIRLHGCNAANTVTWVTAGPATGGTTNPNSQAGFIVGTSTTDTGTQQITVTCQNADGTTTTAQCDVEIYPFVPMAVAECSTSLYTVELNNCGVTCSSAAIPVLFYDCDAENCEYAYITIRVEPDC